MGVYVGVGEWVGGLVVAQMKHWTQFIYTHSCCDIVGLEAPTESVRSAATLGIRTRVIVVLFFVCV